MTPGTFSTHPVRRGVEDVINVAGHRLEVRELESACLGIAEIAEAAVVAVADDARGRVPDVYVTLMPGVAGGETIEKAVVHELETRIGKVAHPRGVHIVGDLPRTPSGEIVHGVLAAISNHAPVGDVTTLANPEVIQKIRRVLEGG